MDVTININGNIMVMMDKVNALFQTMNNTMNATQNIQNNVTNNFDKMGKAAGGAAEKADNLEKEMKGMGKASEEVKKAANETEGLGKKLSDIGQAGMGIDFIVGKIQGLANSIAGAMQTGIDDELAKSNIKVLLKGDAVATDELFSKISDYAKSLRMSKKAFLIDL